MKRLKFRPWFAAARCNRMFVRAGLTAIALVILAPAAAFAQTVGGAGGLLGTAVTWFTTNFSTGIISFGVLFAGAMLATGNMRWPMAACIAAGALVIGNYQTIVSALMAGG